MGPGISCSSALQFYPLNEGGLLEHYDASNLDGQRITVAHELRKLFLVSDNRAFNRLYDFVGHRWLNETMWHANLPSARLRHHLAGKFSSSSGMNITCRPVGFEERAAVPPKRSGLTLPGNTPSQGLQVGNAYIADGSLVNEPMDFSEKNCISLLDLQNLLIKVTRPDIDLDNSPLDLDEETLKLLMEAMSQCPAESSNPQYYHYPDDFCKLFLPGLCRVRNKGALRIYNKVGQAFGFTTENAYVVDVETGRSFFLAATIYTNANGVVNDDRYEYGIAETVMADLAEEIARAVWQIPPEIVNLSGPLDCTPSRQQQREKIESNARQTNQATEKPRDLPCKLEDPAKFSSRAAKSSYVYFVDE
ncbi:uncharacterized protein LOC112345750 [Selaginella moellendorffii]|uniref:uncharacterized protein LOC112345750 n=1 Tax=Selaginella moellendorffii TaxID=88036 RepID=UPI000D1C8B27|nr:uncharacterized protein LOC112345750 [Selaginella moellendorffii]|eukprot:XP_024528841.1 uncharacterized protein LOC112345750 [Selaginella moellendorffii]